MAGPPRRSPLVVTAELGRTPLAVDGLVALADAGAFPVLESSPAYVNSRSDHPCHAGWVFGSQDYPGMAEADVVLCGSTATCPGSRHARGPPTTPS